MSSIYSHSEATVIHSAWSALRTFVKSVNAATLLRKAAFQERTLGDPGKKAYLLDLTHQAVTGRLRQCELADYEFDTLRYVKAAMGWNPPRQLIAAINDAAKTRITCLSREAELDLKYRDEKDDSLTSRCN